MVYSAFALTTGLNRLLTTSAIPLLPFRDNNSLYDAISKGTRTSEHRSMLDVASAREEFKNREISDTGFVRSSKMVYRSRCTR